MTGTGSAVLVADERSFRSGEVSMRVLPVTRMPFERVVVWISRTDKDGGWLMYTSLFYRGFCAKTGHAAGDCRDR